MHGGSLWLVTEEDPEFHFIRWTIPAHMGMAMRVPQVPDTITFHNPSGLPTSIRLTTVDLGNETKDERTLLFQNQAMAGLWDESN